MVFKTSGNKKKQSLERWKINKVSLPSPEIAALSILKFMRIQKYQAPNKVKYTMSGRQQKLPGMQRIRKIQPIMRRKKNESTETILELT